MVSREKIIEAMKTIKAVCENYNGECSESCPFSDKEECYISVADPLVWVINEPDETWKAYKE